MNEGKKLISWIRFYSYSLSRNFIRKEFSKKKPFIANWLFKKRFGFALNLLPKFEPRWPRMNSYYISFWEVKSIDRLKFSESDCEYIFLDTVWSTICHIYKLRMESKFTKRNYNMNFFERAYEQWTNIRRKMTKIHRSTRSTEWTKELVTVFVMVSLLMEWN